MRIKEYSNRIERITDEMASYEAQLAALRDLNGANSRRLTQLSRELTSRRQERDVQNVLTERLDHTAVEVSELSEQLLERSARLLETEAALRAARERIARLEKQIGYQVEQRRTLESRLEKLNGELRRIGDERDQAIMREKRLREAITNALSLLAERAGSVSADASPLSDEPEAVVAEILVAALGEFGDQADDSSTID